MINRFNTKAGQKGLPPGRLGMPRIGSSLQFFRNPWDWQKSRRAKYGNVYKDCTLITGDVIMLTGAEAVEWGLEQDGKLLEGNWPKGFFAILGQKSILFSEGESRNVIRQCVSKAVNMQVLANLCNVAGATVITAELHKLAQRDSFDCMEEANAILRLVASQIVVGDRPEAVTLGELITNMGAGLFGPPLSYPNSPYNVSLKARSKAIALLDPIIDEIEANGTTDLNNASFIELLVASKQLERDEIIDNTLAVLFASFESTAAAFSWSFYHTNKHPTVLERLKAEHQQLAQSLDGNTPSPTDWRSLAYALQVMKETQRMNPSAPFLVRRATQPFEYAGYTVPKGYSVGIGIPSAHHDADYFPNPDQFDPERFNETPNPKGWVPFGKGQRACVGIQMGVTMFNLLWYHLIRDFDWQVLSEPDILFIPVNQPKGLEMMITQK